MPIDNTHQTLLALDTSTTACSVALCCGGRKYARWTLASRAHTRLVLPMVDEVLNEAGIVLQDVAGLAFTAGPGSFTGIRIGFGVAQGLAFGAQLPVAAISTLETMALGAVERFSLTAGQYLLPMLDARMDEVYWALFRVGDDLTPERLMDDRLSAPEGVLFSLPENTQLIVTGDGLNYRERFSFAASAEHAGYYPDARSTLTIARRHFEAGDTQSIEDVQPVYLRDKITWQKRQRLRS